MVNLLRLVRVINIIVLLGTQLLVYYTLPEGGCGSIPLTVRFVWFILASGLVTAAGYVINDYFDVKIDLINKPEKLVVGKNIGRRPAIILHLLLNAIAVITGFMLSLKLGIFFGAIATALWFYSASLKKQFLTGNLLIASLMALGIFAVWLFEPALSLDYILFYSGLAFLLGLVREIVKDLEDLQGDMTFNSRTLPVVLGIYKAKMVAFWLGMASAVFLTGFLTFTYQQEEFWITLYLLITILIPMIFFLNYLHKADRQVQFNRLSTGLKIFFILGILSMIFRCL